MPTLYRLLSLEAVSSEYLDHIAIPDLVCIDVRSLSDDLEAIEGGEEALRWICDQNGMPWDWNHWDYKQRQRLTEKLEELLDHGFFVAVHIRWPAIAPVFRKVDGEWQLSWHGQHVSAGRHRFAFDLKRRKHDEQERKVWYQRNRPQISSLEPAAGSGIRPTTLGPHEGSESEQRRNVGQRMAQMRHEGHGPQRHEGQVTVQQLEERALYKKDPMTGTTRDGVHGGKHQCGRNATKVNSEEAYVTADRHLRESKEFEVAKQRAEAVGDDAFSVSRPLQEIFGENYQSHVTGIHRTGPSSHPTGYPPGTSPPTLIDFENGSMRGVYKKQPNGGWGTHTQFPEPYIDNA